MRSLIGSIVDRQPTNAAPPVPYTTRAATLGRTLLGRAMTDQRAQLDTYDSIGLIWGIVNRTSTTTAAVTWRLWRKAASGRAEDRVEVTSHAALDLWNRPATTRTDSGAEIAITTGRELVEASQQHMDLVGEMWWVVARSDLARSIPLELWVVRPDRIRPVPHRERFLAGYIYTSPDGEEVPLGLDDVIATKMPHPTDPYRGCGPVQALLTSIDGVRYSEEWNRNFFLNSAEPGGIVEIDRRLNDDEWQELNDRWRASHRGVANAHRVAMLEQGAKWKDRSYSRRDMQFAELAAVADTKIMQAYGIPKFAIGMVQDVNRASANASRAWFAEALTIPRLDRIKDTLNYRTLPMFGSTAAGLEFDYDDPVPADAQARDRERTSKATAAKIYIDAGYEPRSVAIALDLPESLTARQTSPSASPSGSLAALAPWAQVDAPTDEEQQDWEIALAALLTLWAVDVTAAQISELVAQIIAAVNSGDRGALATMTVTTTVGADLLAEAMATQAQASAARTLESAVAQGQPAPARVDVDEEELSAVAVTVTALLGVGLAASAGREALRLWGPDVSGIEVADAVAGHLEGLSDASLRTELGGALWSADGSGRTAALTVLPEPDYYVADEVRDRNTCGPCRKADGTRYPSQAAARADYPMLAGYRSCDGRNRCRGTVEPRWG